MKLVVCDCEKGTPEPRKTGAVSPAPPRGGAPTGMGFASRQTAQAHLGGGLDQLRDGP